MTVAHRSSSPRRARGRLGAGGVAQPGSTLRAIQRDIINENAFVAPTVGGFEADELQTVADGKTCGGIGLELITFRSDQFADAVLIDADFHRLNLAAAAGRL